MRRLEQSREGSRRACYPMRMRIQSSFLVGLAVAAIVLIEAPSAKACGGCFVPPGPSTQVTAHRMAFALSSKRTVLWDQIQYVGAPSQFGWVLPIRGAVDVGVSSDELFQRLEDVTRPIVTAPPPPTCPPAGTYCITSCGHSSDAASDSSASYDSGGSVDVWSTDVVGPYEATQLSATDSTALKTWLGDHGYVLPSAIVPVIDQYIKEGFGFIAVKLVPTSKITRMVPIRIGFDGASPSLPLRMIAAGTGANVGIYLWVLGEGRWETKNFPAVEIATTDLVWDWRYGGSNFGALEVSAIATSAGKAWITETSDSILRASLTTGLPPGTTTTEAGTVFSTITDESELDKAFPARSAVTLTRMFASLPQSALSMDVELQASLGGVIPQKRMAPVGINYRCPSDVPIYCPGISPPECAPGYRPDGGKGDGSTVDGSTGDGGVDPGAGLGDAEGGAGEGGGCSTSRASSSSPLDLAGLFALGIGAVALARRRRD